MKPTTRYPGSRGRSLYFTGDLSPLILALNRKRLRRAPNQTMEIANLIVGAISQARVDPSDVDDAWMPADEGQAP
ncbi:hypothetical protein D3C72_777520 [compost metagenome]